MRIKHGNANVRQKKNSTSLTCTKTVKKMTVMMAVRNMCFISLLVSRNPSEKAIAPRRPP